jgi:hypothetical protein
MFRKKENLLVSIDISPKRTYNLEKQREEIGSLILSVCQKHFKTTMVSYIKENNKFSGIDIYLFKSKFKLNKIEDSKISEQFIYRYIRFLPSFLDFLEDILEKTNLKMKVNGLQQIIGTMDEWSLQIGKKMGGGSGGTVNIFSGGPEYNSIKISPSKKEK